MKIMMRKPYEEYLEIKGNDDHTKLLELLEKSMITRFR